MIIFFLHDWKLKLNHKTITVTYRNCSHFCYLVTIALEKLFHPKHFQINLAIVSILQTENVIENDTGHDHSHTEVFTGM